MSSALRILLVTHDMPVFAPVITAKFHACTNGPPAKACEVISFITMKNENASHLLTYQNLLFMRYRSGPHLPCYQTENASRLLTDQESQVTGLTSKHHK